MLWGRLADPLPLETKTEPEEVFRSSGKDPRRLHPVQCVHKTSLSQSPRWAFPCEARAGEKARASCRNGTGQAWVPGQPGSRLMFLDRSTARLQQRMLTLSSGVSLIGLG